MSCYAPCDSALGTIPIVQDVMDCAKFPVGPQRDACMIGKGYQQTSPGHWERHTGLQPATLVKAALAVAALPIAAKVIPTIIKGATSVFDAVSPSGAPVAPALPTSAPAPAVSQASLLPGISPGILLLVGAGLLFALSRKG